MREFDFSNPDHRKLRSYCTHALAAKVFADSSADPSNARTWAYIAQAWSDLACIKRASIERPVLHWRRGPQH